MEYTFFEYLCFFIVYAFLGWCIEVAYHVITKGDFVNRGFLNGPACPIYGFGMNILIFSLDSLKDNLFLLFLGSFLFTSILEFITGFILEKVFHRKWWDYSNIPFNIKGYICLSFSIKWGLGALFIFHFVHPVINKFVSLLNNTAGHVFLFFLLIYFVTDFTITVLGIIKIKRHILLLDEIGEKIRSYSDDLGENIYIKMTATMKATENIKHRLEDSKSDIEIALDERKAQLHALKIKYEKLLKEKSFVHRHLEKAFPNIKEKLSHLDLYKKNK